MFSLYKAELYRLIKDKRTLASGIVLVAFSAIILMLFVYLQNLYSDNAGLTVSITGASFLSTFGTSSSNALMVIQILGAIVLTRVFVWGTIRIPVITGNSRTKIYFSNYLAFMSIFAGGVIVSNLLFFFLSSAIGGFGFDSTPDALMTVFSNIIMNLFVFTFIFFIAYATKSAGASIGITIGASFLSAFLLGFFAALKDTNNFTSAMYEIITWTPWGAESLGTLGSMGLGESLSYQFLRISVSSVVLIMAFLSWGWFIFTKTDLK
jgi:ABC-type transport system involved in multi-copper enzyme maturation permease subunit